MSNFPALISVIISIISQNLSLENDQFASKLIFGFLFAICVPDELAQAPKFNFVEYLARAIHTQFLKFKSMRSFRYQAYLLKLFMFQNDSNFQEFQAFCENEDILFYWPSIIKDHDNMFGIFNFINQSMSKIYQMIFQSRLPIISLELKNLLQLSPDTRTGDWYLF